MKKLSTTQLRARLTANLRAAHRGEDIVICFRGSPVVRLVPYKERQGELTIRPGWGRPCDVPIPPPTSVPVDSLALLLEDRRERFEP